MLVSPLLYSSISPLMRIDLITSQRSQFSTPLHRGLSFQLMNLGTQSYHSIC
jgi:hypothetical protein